LRGFVFFWRCSDVQDQTQKTGSVQEPSALRALNIQDLFAPDGLQGDEGSGPVLISAQANRGRALEDLLERVFEGAGPDVFVLRQHNRWVPWRGRAFPRKGAPLDFAGWIKGVGVGIECKETVQARFPLTESRFPEKERGALERCVRAGASAFLVVAFWKENVLAAYSWPRLEKLLRAKRSLKPEDADFTLAAGKAGELPARLIAAWWNLPGSGIWGCGENARLRDSHRCKRS
jgi:recombination protein U